MQNVVKTKDIHEDDKNKSESIRNMTFWIFCFILNTFRRC